MIFPNNVDYRLVLIRNLFLSYNQKKESILKDKANMSKAGMEVQYMFDLQLLRISEKLVEDVRKIVS